jgi:predicted nucleic acid-binding protein
VIRVFLDTSAVLALLNPKDEQHGRARRVFEALRTQEAGLVTTSFVLVETYALLSRRMGLAAVRAFRSDLVPLLDVVWIDAGAHEAGLDLLLESKKRDLSLVDAVSFVVMRAQRLEHAFAFDPHFEDAGFSLLR